MTLRIISSVFVILLCLQENAPLKVTTLDADKANVLKPQSHVDALVSKDVSAAMKKKHDIVDDVETSQLDTAQGYQRQYPFGQVGRDLVTQNPFEKQVKAVFGNRNHWLRTADGKYEEHKEETWRWKVPEELKDSVFALSAPISKDRYCAFIAVRSLSLHQNPNLCFFDKTTGLVWRKEVPLQAAFDVVKDMVPVPATEKYAIGYTREPIVCVNKTGTRILALISLEQPNLTLIFVYDNEGELLKTSVLRERFVSQRSDSLTYARTPDGDRFRFEFRHDRLEKKIAGMEFKKIGYESDLIDSNGNLLYRFGTPTDEFLGSYGIRFSQNGDFAYVLSNGQPEYAYKLPK